MRNKRAGIMNRIMLQIILVAMIFGLFLFATAEKVNARGLRQQIVEKQTALLIESAIPGMSFEIPRLNLYGYIENVEVKNGRIHAGVNGLPSQKGYPYFSAYSVSVESDENKFVVKIHE